MADPMFRTLRQPLAVAPPDAAEIRLRGERRGRRTAMASVAGAVLVVVAIVAPVAALTHGDKKSAPPVLPSPSRTADGTWVHKIPDAFPLGDGLPMPGEASAGIEHGKGSPLQPCRVGQSSLGQSGGWTDVASATNADVVDPADGTDSRVLALYTSGAEAEQVVASIGQMYAECSPGSPDGGPQVVQQIGDGNAWLLTLVDPRRPVDQLITVERVGNALLVQTDTFSPDARTPDQKLADVRAGQKQVIAAMCVFAASGC